VNGTLGSSYVETETVVVKEIPEPTEKSMLVKLLMSLSEKYELAGSTIEVRVNEVRATFRFPEHNLPKLREIANNWAERGYITATPCRFQQPALSFRHGCFELCKPLL